MTKEFFHYHKDNEKNTFLYKTLDKFCNAEMRRSMYGKNEKSSSKLVFSYHTSRATDMGNNSGSETFQQIRKIETTPKCIEFSYNHFFHSLFLKIIRFHFWKWKTSREDATL